MQNSSMVIALLGSLIFYGWVVWAIIEWRKLKHKGKLQDKFIEKFNTAPELNNFLQSDSGSKFLDFLTIEGRGPKAKLLSSVSKGIILSILGIAFLFIGPILSEQTEGVKIFQAVGIVTIALGIGFLVSTFVSYQLSKKWGIINTEQNE